MCGTGQKGVIIYTSTPYFYLLTKMKRETALKWTMDERAKVYVGEAKPSGAGGARVDMTCVSEEKSLLNEKGPPWKKCVWE